MSPRVSIGLPVFNGEKEIARALDSLLAQTWRDFELIISDNASSDRTADVCRRYTEIDPRIRYVRQRLNVGPMANFDCLLRAARGEYFMWAAHDDQWDPRFVQAALDGFSSGGDSVVAVISEAQYTIQGIPQKFFPEGEAFRSQAISDPVKRVAFMLRFNFGNLYYSLYRRSVLVAGENTVLGKLRRPTLNEIPFFLQVAAQGNWYVLPEVLFFKETNQDTYQQAYWEMVGGRLPVVSPWKYLKSLINGARYHRSALWAVLESIDILPLSGADRRALKWRAVAELSRHFGCLVTRRKRPLRDD